MNERSHCSLLLHIYKKALKMQNHSSILSPPYCPVLLSPLEFIHLFFFFLTKTHCISVGKALQAKQLDIRALVQLLKGEIMASYRTFSQHAYNKPVVIWGDFDK